MNDDLVEHYRSLMKQHGDTFSTAQYSSRKSQEARFAILSQIADLRGAHVLDWGCGTGHLATWLEGEKISFKYTGVDVVPEFIELGRQKHPQHRFGMMSDFADEEFDWVLVSGVFNNLRRDNMDFFKRNIEDLWSRCRLGLAFNLMSSWVSFRDPSLWYVRPEEVFSFMKQLTPFVTLRNDYVVKETDIPFEFAVFAYRKPSWEPA